jgi:hypothetical protein
MESYSCAKLEDKGYAMREFVEVEMVGELSTCKMRLEDPTRSVKSSKYFQGAQGPL